jgi:hypothetical protein
MIGQVFLSGGGDAEESRLLDEALAGSVALSDRK